jgi:hypothetical protein
MSSSVQLPGARLAATSFIVLSVAGLLTGACSSEPSRICRQSSNAEVCLVSGQDSAYKVEASGLKPGSEFRVLSPQGSPILAHVDNEGGLASAQTLAIIEGETPQSFRMEGTASTGHPVVLEFTVPARGN